MRYAILGSLRVQDDTGAEIKISPGHQRSVLAALLLSPGQVVAADAFIDMLWDENPSATARAGLATYVGRLRSALGPRVAARIRHEGRGYLFEPFPGDEIDHVRAAMLADRARNAADEGRWSAVEEAATAGLDIWRGEALADVVSESLRRQFLPYLSELRLKLARLRIDAALARGEFDAILPMVRTLTSSHPLNEPFHERYFLALNGAGRHADAQEWYRQVRLRLREELGTSPSPLLQRFSARALQGVGIGELVAELLGLRATPALAPAEAVPAEPPAPAAEPVRSAPDPDRSSSLADQLPPPPRRFVGREAELARISAAMCDNHPPEQPGLTLLVGMAGVGKSALALTWAHRAAADFPDGRIYLDLKGFADSGSAMDTDDAVRVLLDCLGSGGQALPLTPDGRLALFRSIVAGKRVLIVLDNVRHADQVRPLLPPAGPARILVTSRSALSSLITIDFARSVDLQPLTARESRELLYLRMGRERWSGHEEAVDAIAERCHHLPLALVVAAGRAWVRPDMSLEDLAAQLGESQGPLGALDGGDPAIDVRTVLSWSYRHLSPQAARLYRLLALLPGPSATVPAAASLAAVPAAEAHATLVELVSMNMATEDDQGRYHRHSLLEAFAAERLAAEEDDAERAAARRRVSDFYLHTLAQAHTHLPAQPMPPAARLGAPAPGALVVTFRDGAEAAAWLDREREALTAVMADYAAADGELGV
ncbi:DNA-binding SARP family transcriptional activator [Catenulispora sp. GP43]|uniref:BTAD domain-containing putative transcriptional regulator n=1 Tax=Catenulispora sp. GP43 TaxID=3156263 RepID=UPI003512E43B